jgi:hypothetical protein
MSASLLVLLALAVSDRAEHWEKQRFQEPLFSFEQFQRQNKRRPTSGSRRHEQAAGFRFATFRLR